MKYIIWLALCYGLPFLTVFLFGWSGERNWQCGIAFIISTAWFFIVIVDQAEKLEKANKKANSQP